MKVFLFLWLNLVCSTTYAQNFKIDPHLIDRCLGINQDTPMFCVGTQALACYDDYGGGADMVLSACFEAEQGFWDGALNRLYQEVLVLAKREESDDLGYQPNQLTDAARKMQRSWIAYRDATCGLDLARAYPYSSAAGPALGECLVRETARQYFQLQRIARTYRQ